MIDSNIIALIYIIILFICYFFCLIESSRRKDFSYININGTLKEPILSENGRYKGILIFAVPFLIFVSGIFLKLLFEYLIEDYSIMQVMTMYVLFIFTFILIVPIIEDTYYYIVKRKALK